jgi:peptidoglycan-associated lipoprotein
MVQTFTPRQALRLAVIAGAALSIAACSTRPKPTFETTPPPPAGPAGPTTMPPPPPVSSSVLPGSERDFIINAGERVYFDFDSYSVRADATPILEAQAAWLRRYPAVQIRIEGNCDEMGTREYNLALGARRANAVREFLVARGVAASRIGTVSYGKEKPISDDDNQNRNGHTALVSGARM